MDKQVANVQLMQKMNRLKVFNYIRRSPNVSRPQIAKDTGLSIPSITNIVNYLLGIGIIQENGVEEVARVGRKSVLLSLCESKFDLICVYLNTSYINISITDLGGNIKESHLVDLKTLSDKSITKTLCDEIITLTNNRDISRILGIGIAISGLVLSGNNFVMSAKLKLKSFDIKDTLEQSTGIPVFVGNASIQKAVLYFSKAEHKTDENMIFIDMENGIGAVQYINGTVAQATIGEIGHTTVEKDGPLCFCGNHGCLETMCSPERLISLYNENSQGKISSLEELEKQFAEGDIDARSAIEDCGHYLGIALANIVNLFNPSVMVINTGDFAECPSLVDYAEKELRLRAYNVLTNDLSIVRITENEENILCGMAHNMCDRIFDVAYTNMIIE